MDWCADTDITVAAVIERDNRFLVVHERAAGCTVLNQPGGHIEGGESPEAAIVREVVEETGVDFHPTFLLGVYLWVDPANGRRHLRIVYGGVCTGNKTPKNISDPSIVSVEWLSADEILAAAEHHRYPFVQRSINDYITGENAGADTVVIADPAPIGLAQLRP